MCHVITDGIRFINSSGGQHIVEKASQATQFTIDKAENVIKSLPKILQKYSWKITEAESIHGKAILQSKDFDYNLLDEVTKLESFAKDLQERKLYLESQLGKVNMEIVDIEHAAEFYTLNAAQGYKIYKMLHDTRNTRRALKNELETIQYILKSDMSKAFNSDISRHIQTLDTRSYTPRVLTELFNI